MSKNLLFEEFTRKYKLKGAHSTVRQDYRLIGNFCQIIILKYPDLKSLNMINNSHRNSFYKHIMSKVQKGEVSKNYAKDYLYAVNKLYKKIGKPELCYNVQKILSSIEGKKKVHVTYQEYQNIKEWRKNYGKVPNPLFIDKS